jgi:N-methylhydantoinase A
MNGCRIAVDTGGTFTDAVVVDNEGVTRVGKALTDKGRAFEGIVGSVAEAVRGLNMTAEECLKNATSLFYGTTRATNAIVEGTTARTAFFTTRGFPDILLYREGGKPHRFRQIPYEPPYVPRYLTFEINERINSDGEVTVPLDEASVIDAIQTAVEVNCEAIGVCLLWSIVNPDHEQRVGELIASRAPHVRYTLSSLLNPVIREYRRASGTVIDASLKKLMNTYLSDLEADLAACGFRGDLFIATSYGGAWSVAEIQDRPIYTIGSGPSMAPVSAIAIAQTQCSPADAPYLLVCDTGGTTFDVSLVRAGEIQYSDETWLNGRWTGHITGVRSVAIRSIGAGGGSIASVDSAGLLRVGPSSAGAHPGPACYGRGGADATVTDAAVVLGYIDPDTFLSGELRLDAEAARAAVARSVAEPLQLTLDEAAWGIFAVMTTNIVGAIKEITIAQGIDPRGLTLVAGGGAAGLNIALVARELGCESVLIPSTASAFSAYGMVQTDHVNEYVIHYYDETHRLNYTRANSVLASLEDEADGFIAQFCRYQSVKATKEFLVVAHYPGQVWELEVPLPVARFDDAADVTALEREFHTYHERAFAVADQGQPLECLAWKVRVRVSLTKPRLEHAALVGPTLVSRRRASAYFPNTGRRSVPVYALADLVGEASAPGPAVVRLPTTTIVLYPGTSATVSEFGTCALDFTSGKEGHSDEV